MNSARSVHSLHRLQSKEFARELPRPARSPRDRFLSGASAYLAERLYFFPQQPKDEPRRQKQEDSQPPEQRADSHRPDL